MGLTISSYFTPTDAASQRALAFSRSQRFMDLVEKARRKNILLQMEGKTTIVKCTSKEFAAEQVNEWLWDEPDSEDNVYEALKNTIRRYSENCKPRDELQRAIRFSESKRFTDLVEIAKQKGIDLRMDGKSSIIRTISPGFLSEQTIKWYWNDPNSDDIVFEKLKERTDRSPSPMLK
jgi:predicted transport protein